jgi:tetratricopeptide (TPR) repeat protein
LKASRQKTKLPRTPSASKPPVRPISKKRLWLFRIAAWLLLPLAFCILEAGLRLAGYGYPTGFFKEVEYSGKRYVINNEAFSLHFFPAELARWPATLKFPAKKPAGTCRIFIFGESAAMGDPQPAYGAGRYFEMLLKERFPGQNFEVINLGITAINSHVILSIARDCAKQNGDLWIVYMGNNEMVGPFGAATVFGSQAVPFTAVRINLAIQETRIGQLLMSLARKLSGKSENTSWAGMQMFLHNQVPPKDPRRETVYKNFDRNLRDIVQDGLDSGAKIVLNTVSVNLKDCPPFASLANSNLPAGDLAHCEKLFADGRAFESQSNYVEAARCFEQAAKLDPPFAETQFRWADCLLQLTNAAAREHYQLACDADALPFRADTRINGAIRQLAARLAERGVVFCDAEHALETNSPVGISGDESFFEHVHFNFEGNYRLGRAWAEQVEGLLPESVRRAASTRWLTQEQCEQALGLTDWNRMFVIQSVIRRYEQPPLSSQFNNAVRLQAIETEDRELRRRQAQPGAAAKAREEFETLIHHSPDDAFLHEGFANFLETIPDPAGAITEYRRLLELLPHDFYACLQLGRMLGEQGQFAESESLLSKAVKLRPSLPEGWYDRATVLAAQGKFDSALRQYTRASELRPSDANYICYQGKALAKLNRHDEAITHYRRAIQMRPAFWEAHFELATELAGANQIADAVKEYLEVLQINPRHTVSHVNLGVMLVRANHLPEAIQQFEEALRLEPTNHTSLDYLAQVQARLNPKR